MSASRCVVVAAPAVPGSNRPCWNVSLGGRPYAQIWTFKAKGERHPYHAKLLSGEYVTRPTLAEALAFMENSRGR